MKAVVISEFNTEPSLTEVEPPRPGENDVVVNVETASVNGMDIMSVNGMMAGMIPIEFPITLGRDFAGTIAEVGSAVAGLEVGDPVYGLVLPMTKLHDGTFAEKALVPAFAVVKRPDGLDASSAGALGLAGAAAKIAIDNASVQKGEIGTHQRRHRRRGLVGGADGQATRSRRHRHRHLQRGCLRAGPRSRRGGRLRG